MARPLRRGPSCPNKASPETNPMKTRNTLIAACVAGIGLAMAAPANASSHHHHKHHHHDHHDNYGCNNSYYGYSRPYYRSYYQPAYYQPVYYSAPYYSGYCAPRYYGYPRSSGVTISFGGYRHCYR